MLDSHTLNYLKTNAIAFGTKSHLLVSDPLFLTEVYQQLKSFWSCSHMNCCLQISYTSISIFYLLVNSRKVQKFKNYKSIKYIKSYQENEIEFLMN